MDGVTTGRRFSNVITVERWLMIIITSFRFKPASLFDIITINGALVIRFFEKVLVVISGLGRGANGRFFYILLQVPGDP